MFLQATPGSPEEHRMRAARAKMLIATVTIAAAATVLAVAGMSKDWVYYLDVDEYVAADHEGRRVRLHGLVGAQDLDVNPARLNATFDLMGDQTTLRIAYRGVVPDQFQAGREVVVEGTVDESGVMHADTLLTKCASKYEEGEAPHADPREKEAG
jgi:cytochrome c-type biogenesis protein CcmE